MAETAGALSFGFEADFSGFTRAAEGAGTTLDRLAGRADAWAVSSSSSLSRTLDTAAAQQAKRAAVLAAPESASSDARVHAAGGLTTAQVLAGQTIADRSGDRDDDTAKVTTKLSEQLALLQTTGTAHAAIVERMKIEAEQAKLGSDATAAEKANVAALVQEIDAATLSQTKLRAAQQASNQAFGFVSNEAAHGIESLILDGGKLGDVAAGLLRNTARQGLQAALVGGGPFAGLFGTTGQGGATGGLFGALAKGFGGGSSFAGLFADGGRIGAGQWGVVGEKGAEVVAGPAAVTPFAKLPGAGGGGTQVINFNVTAPDPPAFARSQSQMAAVLASAVGRGGRNA